MTVPKPNRSEIPRAMVIGQLRALGVQPGGVLLVHTSFRATGPIEGGPAGLIGALLEALGPAGTLVLPSFSSDDDHPFDPATTPASPDLGVVAETFRRMPGVRRSEHFSAFAALGPQAARIVGDDLVLPPHGPGSPVDRVRELDGQVLLLGVNHDSDTTIHLAELLAGVTYRRPKYYTELRYGQPVRIEYGENDHCCERFALVDAWLRAMGHQSEGPVGHGPARLTRSRDIVRVVVEHLGRDPEIFLHPVGEGCAQCNEARGSIASRTR